MKVEIRRMPKDESSPMRNASEIYLWSPSEGKEYPIHSRNVRADAESNDLIRDFYNSLYLGLTVIATAKYLKRERILEVRL
ncbi:MAG: hypothetical protein ACETV1_00190 [Candidatus Bathyarchaeia archaeon]